MSRHLPILIVEDNEDDFYLLKRAFKKADIENEIRHVEDGQRAIDYLQGVTPFFDRTAYPIPSLVLLDLKLPVKSGFEVLGWTKQQPTLKEIPVIVFTSSNENADVAKAYATGANAYLVKPSSTEKLQELVRGLEIFWLQHNRFRA